MKKYWSDIFSILFICLVIVLFFLPLFWPTQQILVTPDFGKSDAWHFSFATKYALWESLHQNKLPLWTDKIGDGFPMFAEGQIGTFFLPNLILFRFISDPVLACNLALVSTIIILATGMYVWLRKQTYYIASVFGSLTFTFSGIVILQLPHITLLQGFSLLPWIMAIQSPLVRALLLSQQIFAGFPQATFLTLLLTGSWATYQKKLMPFVISVLLGFGLSSVQLLPSWEFLKQTGIFDGLSPESASYFSFPLTHLASFLNPFALGDPKVGTYPHFAAFNGSIFWENTGYIGLLPLVFLIPAIIKKKYFTSYFLTVLLLSLLLMWGSHSPLYIVYSFWPFNLFRVPSRFLWIFVFALITLSSIGLDTLLRMARKKINLVVTVLFIAIHMFSLFFLWRNYHLLVSSRKWLETPALVNVLPDDARIYTLGSEITHNTTFLSSGWTNPATYETLRNALSPDSNILWGVASHGVYAGRTLRRSDIADNLLTSQIHITDTIATVSASAQKLFDLFGVTHIISTMPMSQEARTQKPIIFDQTSSNNSVKISVVTNTTALPRAYLATDSIEAQTIETAETVLANQNFQVGQSALIETDRQIQKTPGISATEIVRSELTRVTVHTSSPGEALLVLNDTYYPGWNAFLDGVPTPIIPANIRYRAVWVPGGSHEIDFRYQPTSFRVGAVVSGFFLVLIMGIVVFPTRFLTLQTASKVHRRANYHPRSRGTSGTQKE